MVSSKQSQKSNKLSTLASLLPDAKRVFTADNTIVHVHTNRVMVVADIHDDLNALNRVLAERERKGCGAIVFLGDYVDRGTQGVEVLTKLFKLKINDPKHIIMLRGNHEDMDMNLAYGFFEEINRNTDLMLELDKVYKKMPISAIINNQIFCVHGGIGAEKQLRGMKKAKALGYLWNDPSPYERGLSRSRRGTGIFEYGEDVVEDFLKENHLKMIIRGHTALMDGYTWLFEDKLLSLFSAPNYCGAGNKGGYAVIDNGSVEVYNFRGGSGRVSRMACCKAVKFNSRISSKTSSRKS
jgi:diadenosine tetraphosphatase ApaH/serine/threonine PP2A family protein phosphatase